MILVVGGTGSLGGKIVDDLLAGARPVRALVRPSSPRERLVEAGAQVVLGDLKDPASLDRACAGVNAVITTASMSKRNDDTVENVDLRGNLNLVQAARDAGVSHFVFVSTVGASEDSPNPVFRAKAAAERALRESGMTYTILRATGLMDVWFPMLIEMPALSGRPVTLVGESRRRHSFVAERDVAAFAVAALDHPDARSAGIVVGGPEPITFRDAVQAYEDVVGRPIPLRSVAPGEPIPGLPEPVWGFAAALETFDTIVPMEGTAARFGVTLTGVRELARARLGGPSA